MKAFITNRVGDFGFLIGLMLVYFQLGTLDLDEAAAKQPDAHDGRQRPTEQRQRHHLVVEQFVALLFHLSFVLAGLLQSVLHLLPPPQPGHQVARLLDVHGQPVPLSADDSRLDLRLERTLAFGLQVKRSLDGIDLLLRGAHGLDVRLKIFDLGGADIFEPIVIGYAQRRAESPTRIRE